VGRSSCLEPPDAPKATRKALSDTFADPRREGHRAPRRWDRGAGGWVRLKADLWLRAAHSEASELDSVLLSRQRDLAGAFVGERDPLESVVASPSTPICF